MFDVGTFRFDLMWCDVRFLSYVFSVLKTIVDSSVRQLRSAFLFLYKHSKRRRLTQWKSKETLEEINCFSGGFAAQLSRDFRHPRGSGVRRKRGQRWTDCLKFSGRDVTQPTAIEPDVAFMICHASEMFYGVGGEKVKRVQAAFTCFLNNGVLPNKSHVLEI